MDPKEDKERERSPKNPLSRRDRALRILLIVLAALAVTAVAAVAVWNLVVVKPSVAPKPTARPDTPVETDGADYEDLWMPYIPEGGRKDDFYTFLIVGRDTGGGGNTDTILLAAYDLANQKLAAMSLLRDTMVNVSWDIKKINSVYNVYGGGGDGIEALKQEVGQLVGFVPDFHVVVEWEAVGELVDAVGGVTFDVPLDMSYDDPTQDLHIHISKGFQHLDGEQVMQVLRFRKNNNGAPGIYAQGDIGRIQVQQDLLMAIADKLLQPSVVAHIPELVDIFMENVETDLTIPNLLWLAKSAIQGGLRTDSVNFVTLPANYNGYFWSYSMDRNESYVFPKAGEIVELVNEDFNPYLTDVTRANLDIVYKNSDGSIAATRSAIKDSKANPAYYESLLPEETEPPEETEAPEETGTPGETEPPGETETPGGTEMPGGTETPETPQTPGETGTPEETEPPAESQAPAETETGTPSESPAETEDGGETSPGDIGIPIFTPPEVPAQTTP